MNLLDLMSIEYRKSRRTLYASLACGGAVYIIVLIDTLFKRYLSEPLAIVGLVLQAGILVMKYFASRYYDSAEEIRRIAVLKDGLGIPPSESQVADILSRVGNSSPPKRAYVGKYFASEQPASVARLLENVEESCFWTQHIASFTGRTLLIFVFIGAAISVLSLVTIINAGVSPEVLKNVAEAVVVTLGFVVTGEFLLLSLQYSALSQRASEKASLAATQLKAGASDRDAAVLLFGDYNCALAASPPLPKIVYDILHSQLSRAWAARRTELPVE